MCLLRGTDWVFIYNSTFCPHSVFMCFVWIWEQTAIFISLYSINWLVFITETQCVYCAVRTESLKVIHVNRGCVHEIRLTVITISGETMGQVELVTSERYAYCMNHWTVYKWMKSHKVGGFPDQVLKPGPHEYKAGRILILPWTLVIMKTLVIITVM